MTTFGYIFVLVGVLLIRQVVTGRAKETPQDIRDLAIAFFNADVEGIKSVVSVRGSNVAPVASGEVATVNATGATTPLAQKMVELGEAASGYVWGASGPKYYDCSGLVWRAAQAIGVFNGPRFTTHNFARIASPVWVQVQDVAAGDVILWTGKHMGVSLGGDAMYSARSTRKGIGQSSVKGDTGAFGFDPTYWRLNNG